VVTTDGQSGAPARDEHRREGRERTTRRLLAAGVAAGPVYVLLATGQILFREGFDVRVHAVSLLANGPWGWVQVANFILAGALVIAGAIGLRRGMRGERGGTWGPLLLWGYGLGLIGSGIFVADPGAGFPPGIEAPGGGMTRAGLLHFAFGGLAFYSLIGACLVWVARFRAQGRTLAAVWSGATGLYFLGAFSVIASGSASPGAMLGLYLAVLLGWLWHGAVTLDVAGEPGGVRPH
jgi:hypothetical protein